MADADRVHATRSARGGRAGGGGHQGGAAPSGISSGWLTGGHDIADTGYVSTANGVVYAGSTAPAGPNMYALDAATGRILWRFSSGGSVTAGAAIAGDRVYWGSGYVLPVPCPGTVTPRYCPVGNDKFYAFAR